MPSGSHGCLRGLRTLSKTPLCHRSSFLARQLPPRRWTSTTPTPQEDDYPRNMHPQNINEFNKKGSPRPGDWIQQEKPGVEQGSDLIYTHSTVVRPSGTVRRRDGQDLSIGAVLDQDDLFHPMSTSPIPDMRKRAAIMKRHAYCSHPNHHRTRVPASPKDPESRKPLDKAGEPPAFVNFECPDCGIPTYCSEEHWMDDYENHMELCDTLRQINEDEHDLRSGRYFSEFDYPHPPIEESMPNMSNWDTYFYTREYNAINEMRSMRQVTRLMTYPITIASIIHEFSPYDIRGEKRLTTEGLKSFTALRYTLHPPKDGRSDGIKGLRITPPPIRIFMLGARAESSLPRNVWQQLVWLFPNVIFHLIFIGPESMMNRERELPLPERTPTNPFGSIMELVNEFKVSTYVDYFHTLHDAEHFYPYDPYFDCFVLFHPGLGHPASIHEWKDTIPKLLETKCPVITTGYTEWDMKRDVDWMNKEWGTEMDVLMTPGENKFRSLRWEANDLDPSDLTCGNWGVWAWRGKRYDVDEKPIGFIPDRLRSGYKEEEKPTSNIDADK